MAQINQQSNRIAKPHSHILITQMSIKEGIKRFGDEGNTTLLNELYHLHERQELLPKKEDMSYKERKKALRYDLNTRHNKARGCVDGRSQREYTTKVETSLPTVSLEAMMMKCAIDTKEGRYVAVANIPGAVMHVDMEQDVNMLLEDTISELIRRLEPKVNRNMCEK